MLISYNNTDHLRVIEIILEKTIEYDDSSSDLKKDAKDIQFLTGKINIGHSVFLNAEEFLCINNWDYKGADWNLFYPEELQTEKSIIIGLHDSYLRFFLKRKFGVLEEEDMYNMNYLCYESFVMNTISLNRLFLRDGNMEEQSLANICRLFKDAKHINSRYEIIEDIIIFESLISGIELWGPLTSNIALIGFAIPLLEPFLRAVYRKGLPISTTLALINVNDDPSVRSLKVDAAFLGLVSLINSSCKNHETIIVHVDLENGAIKDVYDVYAEMKDNVNSLHCKMMPYIWSYDDSLLCRICHLLSLNFWRELPQFGFQKTDRKFIASVVRILCNLDFFFNTGVLYYTRSILQILYTNIFLDRTEEEMNLFANAETKLSKLPIQRLTRMKITKEHQSNFFNYYCFLSNLTDIPINLKVEQFLYICESYVVVVHELGILFGNINALTIGDFVLHY